MDSVLRGVVGKIVSKKSAWLAELDGMLNMDENNSEVIDNDNDLGDIAVPETSKYKERCR